MIYGVGAAFYMLPPGLRTRPGAAPPAAGSARAAARKPAHPRPVAGAAATPAPAGADRGRLLILAAVVGAIFAFGASGAILGALRAAATVAVGSLVG